MRQQELDSALPTHTKDWQQALASTAAKPTHGEVTMIALLEARAAGLLSRQHWLPNLVAGVIVGVVALPLAMAFAIASGADRKSTRLNSSHSQQSRMPSSA